MYDLDLFILPFAREVEIFVINVDPIPSLIKLNQLDMEYMVINKPKLVCCRKLKSNLIVINSIIISGTLIIPEKNIDVNFGIKNIFNYKDSSRFGDFSPDILSSYDPGRRFFIQLEFKFNNKYD